MVTWHERMPHRLLDACVEAKPVSARIEISGWAQPYAARIALGSDHAVYVFIGALVTQHVVTKAVLMAYVLAFAMGTEPGMDDGKSLDLGAIEVARVLTKHGEGVLRFWRETFDEARAAFLRHLAGEAGYVDYVGSPTAATQPVVKTPAPFVAASVDDFRDALSSSERRPWTKGKAGDA